MPLSGLIPAWKILPAPRSTDGRDLAERVRRGLHRDDVWINDAGVMLHGRFEDIASDVFGA